MVSDGRIYLILLVTALCLTKDGAAAMQSHGIAAIIYVPKILATKFIVYTLHRNKKTLLVDSRQMYQYSTLKRYIPSA